MSLDAISYSKRIAAPSPAAKLVLFIIAENTFNDSGMCRVGQKVLADDTGMTDRSIRTHLGELARLNIIKIHIQPGTGTGRLPDAIELVGFLEWLSQQGRGGGGNRKTFPNGQPEKIVGGNRKLFSGSYKEYRTSDSVQVKVANQDSNRGKRRISVDPDETDTDHSEGVH